MILTDEQIKDIWWLKNKTLVSFGRAIERAVLEQVAQKLDLSRWRKNWNRA